MQIVAQSTPLPAPRASCDGTPYGGKSTEAGVASLSRPPPRRVGRPQAPRHSCREDAATVTFCSGRRTSALETVETGGAPERQRADRSGAAGGTPCTSISSGTTAEDIDRRLWLELTPEQYGLVRELIRLEADAPIVGLLDETERLIDGLEAHLPAWPRPSAIIAEHLIESGVIYEDGASSRACCERGGARKAAEPTS